MLLGLLFAAGAPKDGQASFLQKGTDFWNKPFNRGLGNGALGGLMAEMDWSMVPEMFRKDAKKAFAEGEVIGVLCTMDNMTGPFFVAENITPLKEAGLLENAVLSAWVMMRVNSRHTGGLFDLMFACCDREKLRACGDPLPKPGPFTLYRGCAGNGRARKVRGYSWTADCEKAKWFANRLILPDPAVYQIEAPDNWILAYVNNRKEREFLVQVPKEAKIKRIWRA
jgi:hypothetical protein